MPREEERRVTFEYPFAAHIMAIDGTWRRSCRVVSASDVGATLQVEGSLQGLAMQEFFLLLSSTGLAYRRCRLDHLNGSEVEVTFLRQNKKGAKRPSDTS